MLRVIHRNRGGGPTLSERAEVLLSREGGSHSQQFDPLGSAIVGPAVDRALGILVVGSLDRDDHVAAGTRNFCTGSDDCIEWAVSVGPVSSDVVTAVEVILLEGRRCVLMISSGFGGDTKPQPFTGRSCTSNTNRIVPNCTPIYENRGFRPHR